MTTNQQQWQSTNWIRTKIGLWFLVYLYKMFESRPEDALSSLVLTVLTVLAVWYNAYWLHWLFWLYWLYLLYWLYWRDWLYLRDWLYWLYWLFWLYWQILPEIISHKQFGEIFHFTRFEEMGCNDHHRLQLKKISFYVRLFIGWLCWPCWMCWLCWLHKLCWLHWLRWLC